MTQASAADAARRRAERRRRLQQRQTVIFGVLITMLLAVALVAGAMWSGVLPSPVARPFSTPAPTEEAQAFSPCPPPDALPVPFGEITANVYNGTTRGGLAATTASQLSQFGVVISSEANNPGGRYSGTAQIVTGPIGITSAYTVAALIPDAVVALESDRTDQTVDVVLGDAFESVLTPETAAVDPTMPLEAPAGCTPVDAPTAGEGGEVEQPAEG
ncbi:LytR C-terminal domain-containing protein [Georgenia sp. MJ206]|uniref:LytR C-terminal domain-containing protein n=1 Tax=Georgenia wangjunii TaxID=3117730 RepID=UPI002F26CBB0